MRSTIFDPVNLVGCKSPHHQLPGQVVSISDACGGKRSMFCSDVKASAALRR